MKILHIETGRHWLGGPAQVLYLMQGLKMRGHGVCLVCPKSSALGLRAADAGLEVQFTAFDSDVDPRLLWGATKAIRAFDPDIVHLHSRRGADTLGAVAARLCHRPTVLSRRVDYPLRDAPLVRWRYENLFDHIIAISEAIRRVVIAGGVAAENVTTVHSAVNIEQFHPDAERAAAARSELGVAPDAPLFAIVAHMIPRKGHDVLWNAVKRLSDEAPELRVAVFGKGDSEQRLRDRAAELGIDGHLVWCGFREDLPDVLPAIDCLVHPARMEGLGVAILQALACAKPVIACPVGGIPEAVSPPEDGWLVPVDDDAALADAMRSVIADPSAAALKGAAGRILMERSFSVDAMVEGNLAVYEKVLRRDPRTGVPVSAAGPA
ncbi:MAG TPA: glycosyltransferase family 4 protein [Armatimonadota bacterium]